jgi:hypothetical protein
MALNLFNINQSEDIQSRWNRLLQSMIISQNQHMIQFISSPGGSPAHNPIIDHILPSLLLLQFVSIFEDAAIQRYGKKDDLYKLINCLADKNLLLDKSMMHSIRLTRNKVAHNLQFIDWSDLSNYVDAIEKEMQNWKLIGSRPEYQFYGERSQFKQLETENFSGSMDYEFGIKLHDNKIMSFSWTTTFSLPK